MGVKQPSLARQKYAGVEEGAQHGKERCRSQHVLAGHRIGLLYQKRAEGHELDAERHQQRRE